MQDDTEAAVTKTLQMVTDSKAGLYSNSAGPSRQATDNQSGVLFPDPSRGIPLPEIPGSTAEERRPDHAVVAADGRDAEPATAAAAGAEDVASADRPADMESGNRSKLPPTKITFLRKPLKRARLLLIMFILQAIFYVFFAITLAGVGANFLYGIPAIISVIGSALAVITVITDFSLQVVEGRGAEGVEGL